MFKRLKCLAPLLAAGVVAAWLLPVRDARAAPAGYVAAARVASLDQAVQQGAEIFAHDRFGGVRTCSACHTNGGKTAGALPNGSRLPSLVGVAAEFPKFIPRKHRVITLEQQLAHCIQGGVRGKAPPYDSPQMVDLIVYLTSLSKGSIMGKQFK